LAKTRLLFIGFAVAINLDRAYKNFFEGRTKFPSSNQSWISSLFNTANVTVVGDCLNIPKIGLLKQYSIDLLRKLKTVTISKTSADKYFASILVSNEGTKSKPCSHKSLGLTWD